MNDDKAIGWQKLEGIAVFITAWLVWYMAPVEQVASLHWAWVIVAFFAPDLSFVAYLAGPRLGAMGYNLVHLYGSGAAIAVIGLWFAMPCVTAVGILWIAHAGMDRAFGYGLKLPDNFAHTHLGNIGKAKS